MSETTVTVRPAWVQELVDRFGEPAYECLDPIVSADRERQSWAWRFDAGHINVHIDDMRDDWYVVRINRPDYLCYRATRQAPTDDVMRAMCALAWPTQTTDTERPEPA